MRKWKTCKGAKEFIVRISDDFCMVHRTSRPMARRFCGFGPDALGPMVDNARRLRRWATAEAAMAAVDKEYPKGK